MSGTSESKRSKFLCRNCDKCLAVDGEIKCAGCGDFNPIHADSLRAVAVHMLAHSTAAGAVAQQKSTGNELIRITIERKNALGYVQYPHDLPTPPLRTSAQMGAELTAELASAMSTSFFGGTPTINLQRAMAMAHKIVDLTVPSCCDEVRNEKVAMLLIEHNRLALELLQKHEALIRALADELVLHGTLEYDTLKQFFAEHGC